MSLGLPSASITACGLWPVRCSASCCATPSLHQDRRIRVRSGTTRERASQAVRVSGLKYPVEEGAARMKITNVEPMVLYAQDDEYEGEANVGGYTGYQLVVRVDTDEGIHGWGEACVGSENGEAAYAVKELIERGLLPRVK